MYKRPKASDTEADILRFQRQFQQEQKENTVKLAATVVSAKKEENDADFPIVDIEDQLANTFEAIPQNSNLGKIVEKTADDFQRHRLNFNAKEGFPKPKRRSNVDAAGNSTSIFAQQFKKVRRESNKPFRKLSTKSVLVAGKTGEEIHADNIKKMQAMSEADILEEREHLIATMDPAIIAFLKSRRQTEDAKVNRNPTIQEQNEAALDVDPASLETTQEILNQADNWVNFNAIETNKLAWMKDLDLPKINKKKSFEARFDFLGWLMPYTQEISEKSRVLHHHGEDPARPGYTLQELFQLSRSTVVQQKITALNTIANVLELQSTGVYADIIDLPIEQIFFVVRFCLDDNTPSVLNAAVKAMRNLFFSKIDETCLDGILGFGIGIIQPILAVDSTEDDDRVNDQQMAETNMVKCLMRSSVFIRIRYIINTVKPPIETAVYCLEILIRLARDSEFVLKKLYTCENLISCVITTYALPDSETPLSQAVKLLRVLATRSKQIAMDFIQKYGIMNAIAGFLTNDKYARNANGLKLQSECYHLLSVFLHYNLALEFVHILTPVLLELLQYHFNNSNLDIQTTYVRQGHVAALLSFFGSAARHTNLLLPYLGLIHQCSLKWFRQFTKLTNFSCGKLQIVSSLSKTLAEINRNLGNIVEVDAILIEVFQSESFNMVTKTLANASMLLNDYATLKCSPNLRTIEVAAWYCSEHVVPIIQNNSPIPFLTAISDLIQASTNLDVKIHFLHHENITKYINSLRMLDKCHLSEHWLTRIESNLILNILKISVDAKKMLLDTRSFYELAIKCLSVFTAEQKFQIKEILQEIIFNRNYYPSEVLMQNLSIEQRSDSLETSLDKLDEICTVYSKVLSLEDNVPAFDDCLCLNHATVIPIDWIYTPIILLYSNQHQKKNQDEAEQVFIIRNCLRWILIYESYFPELAQSLNPTDRYCRLACVFLGSDTLFLIEEIHNLLKICFKNVLKNEANINFNKEIQGLTSFQDFYIQLLEQYQGVSYGNTLFGNIILVPLAQRHSSKWRKTLWSEYFGVAEIFNVTAEQSMCDVSIFLNPVEEDLSLLTCYRRALFDGSLRKISVLHHIARHHVGKYRIKNNS